MGGGNLSDEGFEDEKSPAISSTPRCGHYVFEWQDPAIQELTPCPLITCTRCLCSTCYSPYHYAFLFPTGEEVKSVFYS
jgi:hypothetical protein